MKFSLTLVPPLVSSPTKGGALVRIYRRCAALQKSNQFCTMGKRQPRAAAAAPNCELSKWAASGWDAPAEHTWKLTPTAPTLFFSRCNGGSQRRLWVRGCSSRTNVCLFSSFRRPLCMESCSPYQGAEVWLFLFVHSLLLLLSYLLISISVGLRFLSVSVLTFLPAVST